MTRETSIYLDAWRFAAAMVVFVGHIAGKRLTDGLFWQFNFYMDEAVTVFFVLSGFVIAYVIDQREPDVSSYAVARASRLYSVALPAILVTVGLDQLGMAIRPELYSQSWSFPSDRYWGGILAGVFFLNQLWFIDLPVGSMLPYWSLCFEAWYYVIFGIFVFAPAGWRAAGICGILLLVGPRTASMLPLWLLGVATYRICSGKRVTAGAGWALCVGSVLAAIGYDAWTRLHGVPDVAPALLNLPDLTSSYVVAPLFAMHLIGFNAISGRFAKILRACARPIRWAAGATFTIYLFHLPIAQFLATIVPWPPGHWATRLTLVAGSLLLMFLIAEVTERRKEPWRRGFTRLERAVRDLFPRQARVAPGGEGG